MKLTFLITLLALTTLQANAQGVDYNEDSIDLEALYQELDEAITKSPQYVKELEKQNDPPEWAVNLYRDRYGIKVR